MECIIPGINLRVLGRALQALARLGDELFLRATDSNLNLIVFDSLQTVCGKIELKDTFFSSHECHDEKLTLKVHMKVFLPLFRGNLDKKMDFCKLESDIHQNVLIVKMKYSLDDLLMTQRVRLLDYDISDAPMGGTQLFNEVSGTSQLSATPVLFQQVLNMFGSNDLEITLDIQGDKVIARNYCVDTPSSDRTARSEIKLGSTEFSRFQLADPNICVNFPLKPLRTMLQFADMFNLTLNIRLDESGKPLIIGMIHPTYEMSVLVVTSNPKIDGQQQGLVTANSEPVNARISDNNCSLDRFSASIGSANAAAISSPSCVTQRIENGAVVAADQWAVEQQQLSTNTVAPAMNKLQEAGRMPTEITKYVFARCFESTFHNNRDDSFDLMAANSDTEDV